jgi:hypothetical protein
MAKILLLAGLGWIVAPAIASAQQGVPPYGAGGSSAIEGLGHAGSGSVSLPDEVPQGRRLEQDQTRQNMSGRNCNCDDKAPKGPSTESKNKCPPPSSTANPQR